MNRLMNRLYPITKFSKTSTLEEQLEHVIEEFVEAMTAEPLEKRDEELADLEHSIQTYFDMRAAKGVDVNFVRQKVIE